MKKIIIGIDISKEKLDLCVMISKEIKLEIVIKNAEKALKKALQIIAKDLNADYDDMIVCAEYTGMYIYPTVCACNEAGVYLWMENPTEIKYSSGVHRGKNDTIDAARIALYCFRFLDKARRYTIQDKDFCSLKSLLKERELYLTDKAKYYVQLKDQKKFMNATDYQVKKKHIQRIIAVLEKTLVEVNDQIEKIISNNSNLKRQASLLQSIDGIGKQLAVQMMVITQGFSRFENYRQFCCYAGLAPFQYTSGGSVHSKNRVSQKANKKIKSLIHMGALAAARNKKSGELRAYYERKVAEGKNPMLVLNTIRAKLVARMFAVILHDKMYDINYQNRYMKKSA